VAASYVAATAICRGMCKCNLLSGPPKLLKIKLLDSYLPSQLLVRKRFQIIQIECLIPIKQLHAEVRLDCNVVRLDVSVDDVLGGQQ